MDLTQGGYCFTKHGFASPGKAFSDGEYFRRLVTIGHVEGEFAARDVAVGLERNLGVVVLTGEVGEAGPLKALRTRGAAQ